jgi:putative oxidoreductase
MMNGINDELILAARLLLATLFLIFGWRKLRDFPGTVNQMAQVGVPTPLTAAAVATFMELPVAFAVAIGAFTRPAAVLMFFYTLGTALIGHRYWTMTGTERVDGMDSFFKKSQHNGRLLAAVHYRCGKIFD